MKDSSGINFNYSCIYAATGIYNPSPDLNAVLLHDENVSIRILGLKSYVNLVDRVFCPQSKESSEKLAKRPRIIMRFAGTILSCKARIMLLYM